MRLLLILFIISIHSIQSIKTVTLSARINKQLPIDVNDYNNFENWFKQSNTPIDIIKINPGIKNILEVTEENELKDYQLYLAQLAPMKFPGLTVISSLLFKCSIDSSNNLITITCDDSNTNTSYEGPDYLINIFSKLIPRIKSQTEYKLINNHLINQSSLDITFDLPNWFPLSVKLIEKNGSESISKNLDNDLTKLLESIYQLYKQTKV